MISNISRKLSILGSALVNSPHLTYRLGRHYLQIPCPPELYYVVPQVNWAIDEVGQSISKNIQKQFGLSTHLTSKPYTLVDHILHYGELWAFANQAHFPHNRFNKVVVTVFHGNRGPQYPDLTKAIDQFLDQAHLLSQVVTSSLLMKERLIIWGIAPEKICCIPLGIDLSVFKPTDISKKQSLRRKYDIPDDAICIGSFQKDGSGWGEGLSPKYVKGPDIFLEVIATLKQQYKLYVLLTGPSRGYVKQGLEKLGVSYRHDYLSNYNDIVTHYHCLDLYLITSREEGGPKAILEAPACGIPVVSTNVGMVPDLMTHQKNCLITPSEDVAHLANYSAQVIEQENLCHQLIIEGLNQVKHYDWQHIAARYYYEVYQPLLRQ